MIDCFMAIRTQEIPARTMDIRVVTVQYSLGVTRLRLLPLVFDRILDESEILA